MASSVYSFDVLTLINENNVNTICMKNSLGDPMYPLAATLRFWLIVKSVDDDIDWDWDRVVHCVKMGALLEHAMPFVLNLIKVAPEYGLILITCAKNTKCLSTILVEVAKLAGDVDEGLETLYDDYLKFGSVLIRKGARIDLQLLSPDTFYFQEWKLLLLNAEKGKTAATIVIGVYGKTCYKFPRDILKIIGRIVYESRFEWIDNVESNKKQ